MPRAWFTWPSGMESLTGMESLKNGGPDASNSGPAAWLWWTTCIIHNGVPSGSYLGEQCWSVPRSTSGKTLKLCFDCPSRARPKHDIKTAFSQIPAGSPCGIGENKSGDCLSKPSEWTGRSQDTLRPALCARWLVAWR